MHEQLLQDAAKTILDIVTTGNPKRVLTPESRVLFVQDHDPVMGLSPVYTAALKEAVERFQVEGGEKPNTAVLSFPDKRPMNEENPLTPLFEKEVAGCQYLFATYGNPGDDIRQKEGEYSHLHFLKPIFSRFHDPTFRLYVLAARPTLSVLELYADSDGIQRARETALAIKNYLLAHLGETMTVRTGRHDRLDMKIPFRNPIIADALQVEENGLINLPGGETFFAPPIEHVHGSVLMQQGSYHALRHPVQGNIRLTFNSGVISYENLGGLDDKVERCLAEDFRKRPNRMIAEMAVGVLDAALSLPFEEMLYQSTILEKLLGFHFAYGSAEHTGGRHVASLHVDNSFRYGDICIGRDKLVIDGKPNRDLLARYLP